MIKGRSWADAVNIETPSAVPELEAHMNSSRISVRLERIRYGNAELNVAIAVSNPKRLFLTFPAAESILNYRADSVRKKIASKSLKAFNSGGRTVGKKDGLIVNKPDLVGALANVSLIEFEDFVYLTVWEAVNNQNPKAIALLAAGFSDSFRSLAYEQMGMKLEVDERIETIAKYLGRYHKLFDWVRDTHQRIYDRKPDRDYYRAINVAINRHLFGVDHFQCDRLKNAETPELDEIDAAQTFILRQATRSPETDPLTLIKAELPRF
jgi:hypothetical protein